MKTFKELAEKLVEGFENPEHKKAMILTKMDSLESELDKARFAIKVSELFIKKEQLISKLKELEKSIEY